MKALFWKLGTALLALGFVFTACGGTVVEGDDDPEEQQPGEIEAGHWWLSHDNAASVIDTDLTASGVQKVNIDPKLVYQVITQGFGASDCWSGNFVGQWRDPDDPSQPHPNLQQACDWLFSQDFDANGNPVGIGLSQWRINLGGGSWEQGINPGREYPKIGTAIWVNNNASSIFPPNYTRMEAAWERRAESFLADIRNPKTATSNPKSQTDTSENPLAIGRLATLTQMGLLENTIASGDRTTPFDVPLVYDWSKCAGQQFLMREAKRQGVEIFTAFSNSPPIPFTLSGTANSAAVGSTMNSNGRYTQLNHSGNLKPDAFGDFAGYMADVCKYFSGQTITDKWGRTQSLGFDYISPVNEPGWEWNENKQEGSRWNNANIALIARAMDTAFTARNLATNITFSEAARWDHLYEGSITSHYSQIDAFFNSANSTTYIGNIPAVNNPKMIAGHTYFTHGTDSEMTDHRVKVRNKAAQYNVEVHQTEWCGLGGGGGISSIDHYYDCALFMAKLIYADFTILGAMSWNFWTAFDMERGGKSRYSLVGYTPGASTYTLNSYQTNPITSPGAVKTQPTLWALGNYSRFIRPGFRRISLAGEGSFTLNNTSGLMATAYISPNDYKEPDGTPVKRIVAVYVNMNSTAEKLGVSFPDGNKPRDIRCYLTVQNNYTNPVDGKTITGVGSEASYAGNPGMRFMAHDNGIYNIPARSILTVVYDF